MLCSVSGVLRPLEASVLWRWDALPTITIQLEGKELGKGLSSLPSLQAEISWLQAHRKLPGSWMLSGKLSWWPALLSGCPSCFDLFLQEASSRFPVAAFTCQYLRDSLSFVVSVSRASGFLVLGPSYLEGKRLYGTYSSRSRSVDRHRGPWLASRVKVVPQLADPFVTHVISLAATWGGASHPPPCVTCLVSICFIFLRNYVWDWWCISEFLYTWEARQKNPEFELSG